MYSIRLATLEDAGIIAGHRHRMFVDMGKYDPQKLDAMVSAYRPWLESKMAAGEYLSWFATSQDGAVAAGLGLWLMDWPPHVIGSSLRRGNIINVYTEAAHRRRGLARQLMNAALDWCRANGVDVIILHASKEGRHLYESVGFEPTNEMRLLLNSPASKY
jgi:GNAT superfamily N-acetyltransferase